MRANKKDGNHKEISDFIKSMGFFVRDCSASKDGSQDVDWYDMKMRIIPVEYKTKYGKLTNKQIEFRKKNPFYKIEECRSISDAVKILKHRGWLSHQCTIVKL